MALDNYEMRAIEIMIEQMERLESAMRRNRQSENPVFPDQVVRDFYDENTRMGRFELNYFNAIKKNLAANPNPEDMTVTTIL